MSPRDVTVLSPVNSTQQQHAFNAHAQPVDTVQQQDANPVHAQHIPGGNNNVSSSVYVSTYVRCGTHPRSIVLPPDTITKLVFLVPDLQA